MAKTTDIRVRRAALYFLPVKTRVPLKFGAETLTHVTCARVKLTVTNNAGDRVEGWGETPLNVQWVWPSEVVPYEERHEALREFCRRLTREWAKFDESGHALEVGHKFQVRRLPDLLRAFNGERAGAEPMPWLAALVCCSAFDIALHDAFGMSAERPTYETYSDVYMNADLSHYLTDAVGSRERFRGRYPVDYLAASRPEALRAWHLVGGRDLVSESELTGREPDDGYPVLLRDWIRRDGLKCLKVKLRGTDAQWDCERLVSVGTIGTVEGVEWLATDFNCTVTEPDYVNEILDRLRDEHPRIYGMILYVEQPFPYDLEAHRVDVHSVPARKPLFMDESAHDWSLVKLGRELGWTSVALKTCKTQTGALLTLCWAREHGMTLMVQDLTNPMLAQIPHCLLAAHARTIMGVETNGMQFYPEASRVEARVHPGLYVRRNGEVRLDTVRGPGFGYRLDEIDRDVGEPECEA